MTSCKILIKKYFLTYSNFFLLTTFQFHSCPNLTGFNVKKYIFNSMLVQIFGKEKLLKTFINVDDKILLSLVVSFVIILTSTTKTTHSIYIFSNSQHKTFLVRRSIIFLSFFYILYLIKRRKIFPTDHRFFLLPYFLT